MLVSIVLIIRLQFLERGLVSVRCPHLTFEPLVVPTWEDRHLRLFVPTNWNGERRN